MVVLFSVLLTAFILTDAGIFSGAQLWAILGVALTAIGLLGGWVAKLKSNRKNEKTQKEDNNLSLYIHFVDDLQVELKRLHDLLKEERAESAKALRQKDIEIEKSQMKIVSLQQLIEELEANGKG